MKTLIIVAHPNFADSRINKRWAQESEKYPDEFTVHKLYEIYPNEIIDVKQEQALVEAHGSVILQFPFYWFNCPPLLKKWLDEVLTQGWAFGPGGDNFANRNVGLAVSAGSPETSYGAEGSNLYTLEELLRPFEVTAQYINAKYKGFTALYGAEHNLTETKIEHSVPDYIEFLRSI